MLNNGKRSNASCKTIKLSILNTLTFNKYQSDLGMIFGEMKHSNSITWTPSCCLHHHHHHHHHQRSLVTCTNVSGFTVSRGCAGQVSARCPVGVARGSLFFGLWGKLEQLEMSEVPHQLGNLVAGWVTTLNHWRCADFRVKSSPEIKTIFSSGQVPNRHSLKSGPQMSNRYAVLKSEV